MLLLERAILTFFFSRSLSVGSVFFFCCLFSAGKAILFFFFGCCCCAWTFFSFFSVVVVMGVSVFASSRCFVCLGSFPFSLLVVVD